MKKENADKERIQARLNTISIEETLMIQMESRQVKHWFFDSKNLNKITYTTSETNHLLLNSLYYVRFWRYIVQLKDR